MDKETALREALKDQGYEDTIFFINPTFLAAIEGITAEGRIVYSYEKMIAAYMEEEPGSTEEDAIEWIEYNTIRSIPYMGGRKVQLSFTHYTCR